MEILRRLFSAGDFMPHGYCYLWDPRLVWLHVVSDALIALAYIAIPITLIYVVRKRRDVPFTWMFLCFGVFILACGATHVMEIWTLWVANYWLSGAVKAITALASIPTAFLLVQLIPKGLALPSPDDLRREIAHRKAAEEALRKMSEARLAEKTTYLNALFDNNPVAILVLDRDLRIQMCNPAFERIFQYAQAEIRGMHPEDVIAPAELRAEVVEIRHRAVAGESVRLTSKRRRKDGAILDVEIHAVPLRIADDLAGVYLLFEDVSQRRVLEEQLRQAQKMEAVGSLAGGIAHDFNNFLTVILGHSEMMLEHAGPEPTLCRHLEQIKASAVSAASLTRQLLAFSRKQVLEPRVIDLNTVIHETEQMIRRLIPESIDLRIVPAPDLAAVKADPTQIQQVLMNLVVNARDAMPISGTLFIETANAILDEHYAARHGSVIPGQYVMLAVTDTGIGMDPATQARIFEPFFTTKERGRGTGLGLATVYGIVKQSGGYVWAYSEPGRGTTLRIYLPQVAAVPDLLPQVTSSSQLPAGSETILLAEDDDAVRSLAQDLLRAAGYTVLVAKNPRDAIALVEQHTGPVQLLLTDVVMPGMSGCGLAANLAALRPETKVLYVSGYTDEAIVRDGVLAQGMAFLQKPFTRDALLRKVRVVLDK
ncbi:MAG: response regulator [Acidobacteria bacterium]|nr:response regulator [Acidobacteriota bacterium]